MERVGPPAGGGHTPPTHPGDGESPVLRLGRLMIPPCGGRCEMMTKSTFLLTSADRPGKHTGLRCRYSGQVTPLTVGRRGWSAADGVPSACRAGAGTSSLSPSLRTASRSCTRW